MPRKFWIYLKREITTEPIHRARMGECIWLFLYILDHADWETGTVFDWKDAQVAEEMGMPVDTLRRQRMKLQKRGYISCSQSLHSQHILILDWQNPLDYFREIKKPLAGKIQGGHG